MFDSKTLTSIFCLFLAVISVTNCFADDLNSDDCELSDVVLAPMFDVVSLRYPPEMARDGVEGFLIYRFDLDLESGEMVNYEIVDRNVTHFGFKKEAERYLKRQRVKNVCITNSINTLEDIAEHFKRYIEIEGEITIHFQLENWLPPQIKVTKSRIRP